MNNESWDNSKYNLLVVDDEVEVTKTLYRQFRSKYNVFTATSVPDAIKIMESKHIQVVISDQRMPELTGVDFFGRIKDKYPDALKLILTGYSDIEAVIGAINEGQVFRYITKPWNPVELDTIVNEAFEKYELITNNRKLMLNLKEANQDLEEKIKQRTSELEKSNEKLRELNSEKNKYIGIVAHDLRSPIGAAYSFSDYLLEEIENLDKGQLKKYIGVINERCTFSLNLIGSILDASKIEAGTFDLNFVNQNYIGFVNDCISQIRFLANNKFQTISFQSSATELMVSFDRNRMEQVLNNLLSNAVKYSMPSTTIKVNVFTEDNMLVTNVSDEGQGIPKNELELLFNPYKTTSVKATANEKSTGLGLVITKKIIDAHNGTISVNSEVGEGTTITFKLPLKTE